jgi:hypothetical protein
MIDFTEWAKEEKQKAESIRQTVQDYGGGDRVMALFAGRIAEHEERASWLEKQGATVRW